MPTRPCRGHERSKNPVLTQRERARDTAGPRSIFDEVLAETRALADPRRCALAAGRLHNALVLGDWRRVHRQDGERDSGAAVKAHGIRAAVLEEEARIGEDGNGRLGGQSAVHVGGAETLGAVLPHSKGSESCTSGSGPGDSRCVARSLA